MQVNPLYEHTATVELPMARQAFSNRDVQPERHGAYYSTPQQAIIPEIAQMAAHGEYAHLNRLTSPPNLESTYHGLVRSEYAKLGLNSGSSFAGETSYDHLSHDSARYEDVDI